jgi:menaquinone-dependent protoporphyrinogen oxidase
MRVLVTAAGRHGSTLEIASRVAATLRARLPDDAVVDVLDAADVKDVSSYDAVVLGSAIYMGRWLKDARHVARRINARTRQQVWLFSSGPIGEPPEPLEEPAEVAELVEATHARQHRLFAGRLDRHRLGLAERAMVSALRVEDGDVRDWEEIDLWAAQIAVDLTKTQESFR